MRYPLALLLHIAFVVSCYPLLLACFDAQSSSLLFDSPFSRMNEQTNERCVVAVVALAFSILPPFSLSLYLRRSHRMEGVCISFWWIVVGCRVAAASCGFLSVIWWCVFYYVVSFFVVMFFIGYQGKEFIWSLQPKESQECVGCRIAIPRKWYEVCRQVHSIWATRTCECKVFPRALWTTE